MLIIMRKSGRYGKYGEKKRIGRLRRNRGLPEAFGERTGEKGGIKKSREKAAPRVLVRRAKARDLGFIGALSRKAFHIYGPYDQLLSTWSKSGGVVTLLAEKGKRPVGLAMLGGSSQSDVLPGSVELLAIAVEPSERRCGVGDLLMQEILEVARKRNAASLILHTAVNNRPAQQLFKKHGFVALSIKANFYPRGQDSLMMIRGIDPDSE